MNKVILMGRLTREPDVRYSQNADGSMAIARYTLAVDRRRSRNSGAGDDQTADFIGCVAFARAAEFAEKYLHQGTKVVVTGRIPIRTDRRSTLLMLLLKNRNLRKVKPLLPQLVQQHIHHQDLNQALQLVMAL